MILMFSLLNFHNLKPSYTLHTSSRLGSRIKRRTIDGELQMSSELTLSKAVKIAHQG